MAQRWEHVSATWPGPRTEASATPPALCLANLDLGRRCRLHTSALSSRALSPTPSPSCPCTCPPSVASARLSNAMAPTVAACSFRHASMSQSQPPADADADAAAADRALAACALAPIICRRTHRHRAPVRAHAREMQLPAAAADCVLLRCLRAPVHRSGISIREYSSSYPRRHRMSSRLRPPVRRC
jgi:hypothetical protein